MIHLKAAFVPFRSPEPRDCHQSNASLKWCGAMIYLSAIFVRTPRNREHAGFTRMKWDRGYFSLRRGSSIAYRRTTRPSSSKAISGTEKTRRVLIVLDSELEQGFRHNTACGIFATKKEDVDQTH